MLQKSFHANADTKRFYNRLINPFIAEKERGLAMRIAEHFPEMGTSLLEIGCGEGSNIHYLKQILPTVRFSGIDFSPEKIDFLLSVNNDVEAVCGDATDLPFNNSEYDLVLCRDLLHHVHFAREKVLSEALRVVKQGGVVIVLESDGRCFLNRLFRVLFPAERGMRFSRPELLLELATPLGPTVLDYVEPSFLVRAIAFFLGWPDGGIPQRIVSICYSVACLWERCVEATFPKSRWTYMMMLVRKG